MPDVSVVVPCFNAGPWVARQLGALANQTWQGCWELVFVDNGSTDDSRAIAETFVKDLPHLRIVDAPEVHCTSHAVNRGVAAARGRIVLIADADDEAAPGWLEAMADALAGAELAASRFDVESLNEGAVATSRWHPQTQGLIEHRHPPYLAHAGGCGLGFTKELFQRVGGYDPSLVYLHDTDFCWKAQRAGAKFVFVPNAVMRVRYRADVKGTFRQAANYSEYNVLLYKRYRSFGMPPIDWRGGLRNWVTLARQLKKLRHRSGRIELAWRIGRQYGRLKGSIKHRVLAF